MPAGIEIPYLDERADAEACLALCGIKFDDVLREIQYRQRKKAAEAVRIQRLAAAKQGERRMLRNGDDGGEVQMQVHPTFYHYWGQRLGYECWGEGTDFVREFIRDNPEVRIKSISEKTVVGVDGHKGKTAPRRHRVTGRRGRWSA